jgi:peptidoglycan/xylan/chitin deacetylase (PgdA/CDA1 family)
MPDCLPVLTFPALDDRPDVISFPPRVFRYGMQLLGTHGYQTISLLEAVDCLKRKAPFPARSFVLTFDDGYQSVYTEAFPILERYGMTATVFPNLGTRRRGAPTSRLPDWEGRTMLSWNEIREMQLAGITIGAHTVTHRVLTRLSPDEVTAEVLDGKAVLEDALNATVDCFAYPFGRYDETSRNIVSEHFACACSDTLGLLGSRSPLFALERVDAYYLRTERLFGLMVSRWFPDYIRVRGMARLLRRMVSRR